MGTHPIFESDFDCLTECPSTSPPFPSAKMQLYMCLIVVVTFITSVMAQDTCDAGYWGDNCYKLCGQCLGDNATCNKNDGKCTEEAGCQPGYTGLDCMKPVCDFDKSGSDSQCGTD